MLKAEPTALVFVPDDRKQQHLAIPWEHLRKTKVTSGLKDAADFVGWVILGGPVLAIATLGFINPQNTYLMVTWWEDLFDTECTVGFQVGVLLGQFRGPDLEKRIWAAKAKYKQQMRDMFSPRQ
jgi:hypothetical protein